MYTNENSIFNMSPGFRMVLFISMTGLSMILGGLVTFSIVAAALHAPFTDIQSVLLRPENTSITQIANAFASIIGFGVPALVVAYFTKGTFTSNLGFKPITNEKQVGIVILLAFTGLILSGALGDLTDKITFSKSIRNWATDLEAQYKKALMAMTHMRSIWDLLIAILAIAVVPAIVEELYFRGTLQKIIADWSGKPFVAIVITAILFSAFHFSYFGFLSRMSLGIVLGLIYYYTKTIWLPILMHFVNNAIGVAALYAVRNNPKKIDQVMDSNLTYYWVIIGLAALVILFKQLKKTTDAGLEKDI
ncbi:MAG: CPBP family intramembrane glutamic endopeptidase [Sediminibacterium sp.]